MNRLFSWLFLLGLALQSAAFPAHDPLTFSFREPRVRTYRVDLGWGGNLCTSQNAGWVLARPTDKPDEPLELGRRILFAPTPGTDPDLIIAGRPLSRIRLVQTGLWLVEAPDAWTALIEAQALAQHPDVQRCHPVGRPFLKLQGDYAPSPGDPYFLRQWHLENRTPGGISKGADVQIRTAWPITRGSGVVVSVADDGLEMEHPDLKDRLSGQPHFNFGDQSTNAGPSSTTAFHGTAVAGLVAATGGNRRGVTGVAPEAGLASWVIFERGFLSPDPVGMMDMFQAFSNRVDVQNHSWGAGGVSFYPLPPLENVAISNAVSFGRHGKGVIIVRAASNFRLQSGDANADGYAADPRVIVVAAARSDGRAARYSNPGSCILVAGLSSETLAGSNTMDPAHPSLVTTDHTGFGGRNTVSNQGDAADYRYDGTGFTGTSGATPIISGIVSLMLSARPELSSRDIQQILLLSSRHLDLGDPLGQVNGAGLPVSYNLGFGIPHSGLSVQRAKHWSPRPAVQHRVTPFPAGVVIPDDGMRVEVTGDNIPPELASIPVSPGLGTHPDDGTSNHPVSFLDLALGPISQNLSGRVALVQRGVNTFTEKLQHAADAGAALVIVYDNIGVQERMVMSNTEYILPPAVFMGRAAGVLLASIVATNPTVRVRIAVGKAVATVSVDDTWICEHVGVRVQTNHERRGDLRISLVSPFGTRSILQRVNTDSSSGPEDWTYYSVHHFFESSAGTWRLEIIDEEPSRTGSLLQADLIIHGVPIADIDRDGLEDGWEGVYFGGLGGIGYSDPDNDGVPSAAEQALGTDPMAEDTPFQISASAWNPSITRLSWPGVPVFLYQVLSSENPQGPYSPVTTIGGTSPETEWFVPTEGLASRFFRVQRAAP